MMNERSEQIDEITKALARVQGALEGASKEGTVDAGKYHFKYADLKSVWEACRKPLSENNLAIIQTLNDGFLTTTLAHESGQWFRSSVKLPAFSTMQALGSALTYLRRYSLSALVGIYSEDDDGNRATADSPEPPIDGETGKPKTLPKRPDDLAEQVKLHDAIKALLPQFRIVETDTAPAIEEFLKKEHSVDVYVKTLNKMKQAIADVENIPPTDPDNIPVTEGELLDKDNPDSPDYDPLA